MGLKCRLLGHTYGDTEVQRTREEKGDEVVVTIREVKVCERCESEQTVSQNKEVTAIRTPAEVGMAEPNTGGSAPEPETEADAQPSAAASSEETAESADQSASADDPSSADAEQVDGEATDPSTAEAGAPTEGENPIDEAEADSDGWETGSDDWEDVDTDGDDGVILDGAETERDETQWPEETGTDPASAAQQSQAVEDGDLTTDDEPEVTNDAEIIDAPEPEEKPRERGYGEWHERENETQSDAWPEHEGEDEGFDASTNVDDDNVELGGSGLTPEVNGRADFDDADSVQGVAVEDSAPSSAQQSGQSVPTEDGFARAESSTTLESDVPDDHVEFYCPNCGHARSAGASSMRAGDICPECRKGYIAERER